MPLVTALFAPGNHPRRLRRAFEFNVDAVILDLEDAVPPPEKAGARETVRDALADQARARRAQAWVRVNGLDSGLTRDDLAATVGPEVAGVCLPKVDRPGQLAAFDRLLAAAEGKAGLPEGSVRVIPFVETAGGLLAAREIAAAPRVLCLAFGGLDYCYDLGVAPGSGAGVLDHARRHLVVASRAAGAEGPLDTVCLYLDDPAGLEREARHARALGFQGKLLLHPDQVEPIRRGFAPPPGELELARQVLSAYDAAARQGLGVARVGGRFVDRPVVLWARRVLELAGEAWPDPAAGG